MKIGAYSSDPPACDAFHAFDPESYVVISAINDSLVYIDAEGRVTPGLATAWHQVDPVTMDFELRRGVVFHNGEPFDADSVVATLRAQRDPAHGSPTGQGILAPIASCTKLDPFRVRIQTAFPDALFLHRLHLFSAIYPAGVLEARGPDAFFEHPIGTGAFEFREWRKGREIVLRRNPQHWASRSTVEELRFPIVQQKDWIDLLDRGLLDLVLNPSPHDVVRAERIRGVTVARREAAISQWFLLRPRGPLADRRVRQAMNYALHRPLLCKISEHGWAAPQAGVQTPGQAGFNPDLTPYPYDPDLAKQLLRESGWDLPITLSGLVSEGSASLYQLIREFLSRVGIKLNARIVPRGEWMQRVVVERSFDGDFVLSMVDNPLLHGIFHHFIFFFSQGPFSQMKDDGYDRRFLDAATTIDPERMHEKLAALDAFVQGEALFLTTIRQQAFIAARTGFDLPISKSGHFNFSSLWNIRAQPGVPSAEIPVVTEASDPDVARLLEGTSHPGMLLTRGPLEFQRPEMARLWRNLELHELHFKLETDEMIRALVDQVAIESKFENICASTKQVGILGLTKDGRVLFSNDGYPLVTGRDPAEGLAEHVYDDSGRRIWLEIMERVDREAAWSGVVGFGEPPRRRLFATVTPAVNELKARSGYVTVFTDYSSEEERLRMKAEARTAALVQKALIPRIEHASLDIAEYYQPASETGGDWYWVHDGSRYLTMMIGDVTSHGVAPALVTASVAGAVKVMDLDATPPSDIMQELNRVVRLTGFGEYLMSFYLIKIDKRDLSYLYCSAGHHSPLIISGRGAETHAVCGELLGYQSDEARAWGIYGGKVDPDTLIFLYTDGIAEGRDPEGKEYGFSNLRRFFRRVDRKRPCRAIVDELVADATRHYRGAPLNDDLTLLLARVS